MENWAKVSFLSKIITQLTTVVASFYCFVFELRHNFLFLFVVIG